MSELILESTVYTRGQLAAAIPPGPQAALAGRSNVGKSSLINALAGRKRLAKVSATPGKTCSINFYRAHPEGFHLADLPGYGYARRGKEERRQWDELINAYLRSGADIFALVLLLDCRLDPQKADLDLLAFARMLGLEVLPLLTKADKCTRQERENRRRQWQAMFPGRVPLLVAAGAAAASRFGLEDLWAALRALKHEAGAP
ncbi:MAG: ribosome biogenesis GTP-binding protein YihA/YsxC [Deltaproteobacteria bacterium]|jgi:GTP-binding protein|nr:ribosome biogenesis GTP-binding protein YihA/YsxC [Deltaproteobacteria bacterium]